MIVLNSILNPEATEPCGRICDNVQESAPPAEDAQLLELTSVCFTGSYIRGL